MKLFSLSPIRQQAVLVGLCAIFVVASVFAEGRALFISTVLALAVVFVLRLINPRRHPPAIGFALSCLLGGILANIAWKKQWGWKVIAAFAVSSVLVGLIRYLKAPGEGGAGPRASGPVINH